MRIKALAPAEPVFLTKHVLGGLFEVAQLFSQIRAFS